MSLGAEREEMSSSAEKRLGQSGRIDEYAEKSPEPTRIGAHYQKLRELGSGGEGAVYLVRHLPTGQLRAAKILKHALYQDRLHELNMMRQLSHVSLPGVIDILEEHGQLWLIMEYIRGRSLAELVREGLQRQQIFSVAKQLAEVLRYLHTRPVPILHLDIKPTNILIRPDGGLVLIDFGAAVRADRAGQAGCFGTRGFAAPEQRTGSGIDAHADIYGFGALIYYCVCGIVPADAEDARLRCLSRRVFRIRELRPIVKRCLREEASRRYADCGALCRALSLAEQCSRVWGRAGRAAAALVFLASAGIFALAGVGGSVFQKNGGEIFTEAQECRQLLEMAEGQGFAQALECYRRAAAQWPGEAAWYRHLLTRIEADYQLSAEEEAAVTELIYTETPQGGTAAALLQRQDEESYCGIAYRLGILYWYFYEGAGGRAAAAKWFGQAQQKREWQQEPDWLESARVHADIGSYYEKLGKQDENGVIQADDWTFWKDLKRLWRAQKTLWENAGVTEDGDTGENRYEIKKDMSINTSICSRIAEELLSCLIMQSHDLQLAGETQEGTKEILEELGNWLDGENGLPEMERKRLSEQYEAAAAAAGRVFAMERGTEVEEE